MNVVKINNWSVSANTDDPYKAPEQIYSVLHGDVTDHPTLGDAKGILTSKILKTEGRWVGTKSGTTYELGIISPSYKEWCDNNDIVIDDEWPIKFIDLIVDEE